MFGKLTTGDLYRPANDPSPQMIPETQMNPVPELIPLQNVRSGVDAMKILCMDSYFLNYPREGKTSTSGASEEA